MTSSIAPATASRCGRRCAGRPAHELAHRGRPHPSTQAAPPTMTLSGASRSRHCRVNRRRTDRRVCAMFGSVRRRARTETRNWPATSRPHCARCGTGSATRANAWYDARASWVASAARGLCGDRRAGSSAACLAGNSHPASPRLLGSRVAIPGDQAGAGASPRLLIATHDRLARAARIKRVAAREHCRSKGELVDGSGGAGQGIGEDRDEGEVADRGDRCHRCRAEQWSPWRHGRAGCSVSRPPRSRRVSRDPRLRQARVGLAQARA